MPPVKGAPTVTAGATVFLIRHCSAGLRDAWRGDDRLRPLDDLGFRQAAALARIVVDGGVTVRRLVSSPYLR